MVLIVPLITSPYVSRALGVHGIGVYSYVSSVVYYFFICVTLGLTNYGNRSIAKCRDDKKQRSVTFWSIYKMQFLVGVLILLLYATYVLCAAEDKYRIYFIVYLLHIFGACLDINWFFFGMEEFKFTTIRNAIIKIITLIAIFVFVKGDHALISYFFIVASSTLLSNLFLWTRLFKYVSYYRASLRESLLHLKPNLILFLPIVAMSIYRVMDKIMIKELSGIIENGYYENADRIITISLTAFSAIATVMMPAISNMVANNNDVKVKQMLRDMMQVVNVFSIAMVFGLIAIANRFAPLFFGDEFVETGALLVGLSPTIFLSGWKMMQVVKVFSKAMVFGLIAIANRFAPLFFVDELVETGALLVGLSPTIFLSGWKNVLRSQYIIPYEKDKAYVFSLVIGAICNVIVNMIFIPKYGARGAIIGTLMAELVGFIIQTYVVAKDVDIKVLFKDFVRFIPAGVIMGILAYKILYLMPNNMFSIAIVVLLGGCIYVCLAGLTLYISDKNRFDYLLSMCLRRRKMVN